MIAALASDGRLWYSLTQANTDSNVLLLFVQHLVEHLDAEDGGWRKSTILLVDGAKYHVSRVAREGFAKLRVRVLWTAPYSYDSSPIERLFAALKSGNLNPEMLSTGKR